MIKILLFLGFIHVLHADLEDHLKAIKDKSGCHQIRNVDFIYMINLDERPEKFQTSVKQLAPYEIYPYRFPAINGWELPLDVINDVGLKYEIWMPNEQWGTCYLPKTGTKPHDEPIHFPGRTYFLQTMALGTIGCALSHLSVLQDAYNAGYNTIWVMEDDIEVIQDPNLISNLIDRLDAAVGKEGWDILFTDQDTKGPDGNYIPCFTYAPRPNFTPANPARFAERRDINGEFRRVGARYGAYSMIVRKSGIKKILSFIKNLQVFLPYDMDYTLPHNIRLYTVIEDVISTLPKSLTDNAAPNYKNISSNH
jgi:GR25 family glycosyltransferase involved in LPS biosynthesis